MRPGIRKYAKTKDPRGLRSAIEHAGPSFVKIAQWASQRPDLVGNELSEALAPLTDQHPQHDWETTLDVMEELDQQVRDELIFHMTRIPVGSGSVAQVYRSCMTLVMVSYDKL